MQSASFRPPPSWYQSGKAVRGLTGPTALSFAWAGAARAVMANVASNATRTMRVRRTGSAVMAAAACRERVLVKDLPPEESWVQVGNHPTGARAFFSPHNAPSAVRDRARLREAAR